MKILFTIHTYFQLLIVMNMKKQFFNDDVVDIVMSDVSNNSDKIVQRLEETHFFHRCYYAWIKDLLNVEGRFNKFKKFLKADLFHSRIVDTRSNLDCKKYDLFIFYQFDSWTDSLYFTLKKHNPKLECRRMQETFNSYLNEGGLIVYSEKTEKIKNLMRRITFNPIIRNDMSKYYYFDPDMILFEPKGNYEIIRMEKFDSNNAKFMETVNYVFDYLQLEDQFKEKYIYFESIEHDEFDLIQYIANHVGKENFIVKIHPRSQSNKYKKAGIKTNKNISIPWEVILLNKDFTGRVFLTATSQAVFGFLQFTKQDAKGVLLYNCIDVKIDPALDLYLNKMQDQYGADKLRIPQNMDDFRNLLREI